MKQRSSPKSRKMTCVDPRKYRSFCFRGEGRANFVISAKHCATGNRIVWRFSKTRKSGLIKVKARSELINKYMEKIVSPFFDDQFLVSTKIVQFNILDVHHLAKIPSLKANQKVQTFDELMQLPESMSFLPISLMPRPDYQMSALEMIDATRIPLMDAPHLSPTITVEIKPKQGFFQQHAGIDIPFCNNCILQMEKCGANHYDKMYDFCPLDLYSGSYWRTQKALSSLFLVPHRNLRVFVDGDVVHSDEKSVRKEAFDSTFFPTKNASTADLISALSLVLTGNVSPMTFELNDSSVLGQLLTAQKTDTVGLVEAYQLYNKLSIQEQEEFLDKTLLAKKGLEEVLRGDDDDIKHLLQRYFVAATMKDCSVMVSMQVVTSDEDSENVVTLCNGIKFAYSIKLVDLDPKSPKNLINSHARLVAGAKVIKLEAEAGDLRKPCVGRIY